MTQWLGNKGLLCIHGLTVKVCKQTILSKKDLPYKYEAIDIKTLELKKMTQDELDYLFNKCQEITSIIEAETFRRLEEK